MINDFIFVFFVVTTILVVVFLVPTIDLVGGVSLISLAAIILFISYKFREIRLPLLIGFLIRGLLALFIAYLSFQKKNFLEDDGFQQLAELWSISGFPGVLEYFRTGAFMYAWFMAVLYTLTDSTSSLMIQAINVWLGTLLILNVYLITKIVWSERPAIWAAWVCALFPSLSLYSAWRVREALLTYLFTLSIYHFLVWLKRSKAQSFIIGFSVMILASVLHTAFFAGIVLYAGFPVFYSVKAFLKKKGGRIISNTVIALIAIGGLGLVIWSGVAFGKVQDLIQSGDLAIIAHKQESRALAGRAGYLSNLVIRSPTDFFWQVPLRLIYLILTPFPWMINNTKDIIGLIDVGIYTLFLLLILKNSHRLKRSNVAWSVLIFCLGIACIFALGTSNYGTAMRHRSKVAPLLIVLSAGFISPKDATQQQFPHNNLSSWSIDPGFYVQEKLPSVSTLDNYSGVQTNRPSQQTTYQGVLTQIHRLLTPAVFNQHAYYYSLEGKGRILTLPLMTAAVLFLLWPNVYSVQKLVKFLAQKNLLWCRETNLYQKKRLNQFFLMPAEILQRVFKDISPQLIQRSYNRKNRLLPPTISLVCQHFERIWSVDRSTLELLTSKINSTQPRSNIQSSKTICTVIDMPTKIPIQVWFFPTIKLSDANLTKKLLNLVPAKTLLILDRGFNDVQVLNCFMAKQINFITRLRTCKLFKVEQVLTSTYYVKDQIISIKSSQIPTSHLKLRLVQIRHNQHWYVFLTSVLDPTILPPYVVADLHRRKWRLENVLQIVKQLLGLNYLWTGTMNEIQVQIWASWLFYSVLADLGDAIANELGIPFERISMKKLFWGLKGFKQAYAEGKTINPVVYFVTDTQPDLSVVKPISQPPPIIDLSPYPTSFTKRKFS